MMKAVPDVWETGPQEDVKGVVEAVDRMQHY
jgi:hypothetical protein